MLYTRKVHTQLLVVLFIVSVFYFLKYLNNDEKIQSSYKLTTGSAKLGLTYNSENFFIDGKQVRILSGSIHYFRVLPDYWEHRLLALKAAGLNTIETYCPWNLHEEIRGNFNFDGILNLRRFILLAQKLDLYVILRPGPYICGEWEFGGLPSWLLRDPNMRVRSEYHGYLQAVDKYLLRIVNEVLDLQYSRGGPIIAFQIENEYYSFGSSDTYINFIMRRMQHDGVVEALFISDSDLGLFRAKYHPDYFIGVNANNFTKLLSNMRDLERMKLLQSVDSVVNVRRKQPIFITEFWTGWFNAWGDSGISNVITASAFIHVLHRVLERGYHINFYMFHGGTNFGFLNGGNGDGQRLITSYDYFAPLNEAGHITERYIILRSAILSTLPAATVNNLPPIPPDPPSFAYGKITVADILPYYSLLTIIEAISSAVPLTMEELPINNNGGQSYGYILYRTFIHGGSILRIDGVIADRAVILWNHTVLLSQNEQQLNQWNVAISIDKQEFELRSTKKFPLDILVENLGRVNYATFQEDIYNRQHRGIVGKVYLDDRELSGWQIHPMEFKQEFMKSLSVSKLWRSFTKQYNGPRLLRAYLDVNREPMDTFINTRNWKKGVAFVNGFNLGRYWFIGPQFSLFLPSPLLHRGRNEIVMFEEESFTGSYFELQSSPDFAFTT